MAVRVGAKSAFLQRAGAACCNEPTSRRVAPRSFRRVRLLAALALLSVSARVHSGVTQSPHDFWVSDGYGLSLDVSDHEIRAFEVTSATCQASWVALRVGGSRPGALTYKRADRPGTVTLGVGSSNEGWLRLEGPVSSISLRRIQQLPDICSQGPINTPISNFDVFWRTFAENYPFFELHGVDWQESYRRWRPRISSQTRPPELLNILSEMIAPLEDAHTSITAQGFPEYGGYRHDIAPLEEADPDSPTEVARLETAKHIIQEKYLHSLLHMYCNDKLMFGDVSRSISYLAIYLFDAYSQAPDPAHDLACLDDALTEMFANMVRTQRTKLIVDVRDNQGGRDSYVNAVVSRFTSASYVAYFKKARNDTTNLDSFTEPQANWIASRSGSVFAGSLVLLTGPYTFSGGETFAMALMGRRPTVTRIGENTQGVFSDVLRRHLPNGWEFGLPNEIYSTVDGKSFDGVGVPPDIRVPVFVDSDLEIARDGALQRAIQELEAGPTLPTTTFVSSNEAQHLTGGSDKHALTSADVEAFMDGVVGQQLVSRDIAGATVAVVQDGEVLLAKGYGSADLARQRPVSGTDTTFRIGSTSKLFTWTAIMQLEEDGKLDLDHDVNGYIDFKIPRTFAEPITTRALLTHTAGFEDVFKDDDLVTTADLKPLGSYLAGHIPRRLFKPGTIPAYSNYGAGLAGYIVERLSGRPFNEYVAAHILQPLGMNRSSFDQPLPPQLAPLLSRGYVSASSGRPEPTEILQTEPAGSLTSSAGDMAKFMIAHLQNGQYGNARILRPETARRMHARHFSMDPSLNSMAFGFYEESRNGHRIIGHSGDSDCFFTDLYLILDARVGLFVSYNTSGVDNSRSTDARELWVAFLDRYLPYELPSGKAAASGPSKIANVAGKYIDSRRPERSLMRVAGVLDQVEVAQSPTGEISVDIFKDFRGQVLPWRETSLLHYRAVGDQKKLAFRVDSSGRLAMVVGTFPPHVFQRVGFFQTKEVLLTVVFMSAVMFVFGIVLSTLKPLYSRGPATWKLFFPALSLLNLSLMVLWAEFLVFRPTQGTIPVDYTYMSHRMDSYLLGLEVFTWIGVAGTALAILGTWRMRIRSKGCPVLTVRNVAVVVGCAGFAWLAVTNHLLEFNVHY